MKINKIHAQDCFDDNNSGYIYGIEWDIGNEEWHCEWFEFEVLRDKEYKRMQFMENVLLGQLIVNIKYFFKYRLFQR